MPQGLTGRTFKTRKTQDTIRQE